MPGSSLLCPPAETKAGQRAPGPRGSVPSCPPLPENSELVDAGASPADQRLATIASAKALPLRPLLALGLWSLAKAGAQHESPGPIWVPQPLGCWSQNTQTSSRHIFSKCWWGSKPRQWNSSHPPDPHPKPSFPTQNISSLGLQIFLLINYYASCQISIAITKRLIATMRCGTPLLQGNFLLFMLWHNIAEQSGRTTEHKFRRSPSAEEAILITAEGWQLAPNLLGTPRHERGPTSLTPLTRQDRSRRLYVFIY